MEIKTICPYCGVGCGLLAKKTDDVWTIEGDKNHPANYGRLCSKGASLAETIDLNGRLLDPMIEGRNVSWPEAINSVATKFNQVIKDFGADSVAFYVSGQLLTEDYYAANKLMKGYIGSANIDTNSRLCMSSTVAAYKRAFGSDTVPCCYEDLERAKLIVLVGSNAAWCHPVLYQRIVQSKKDNPDLSVVVIDPRKTSSCDVADLHLSIKPGTDVMLFNGLLHHLDAQGETNQLFVENYTEGLTCALEQATKSAGNLAAVAEYCGLSVADVESFYRIFARTERVVSVFSQGVNQSSSGTDKVNSIINCHLLTGRIGRPGMGPFSFTGQPNAMGGREVGGLSNALVAHMSLEDNVHRDITQRFWQSPVIADKAGYKAVDLFKAVDEGEVKAIWIMCTNPVVSLPDADFVKSALEKCDFVVLSECMKDTDTAKHANVLLPAIPWAEKDGTVTNSERSISRQRAFLPAAGNAKPDWWIISQVAKAMGFEQGFSYESAHEIFIEHAALSGFENKIENKGSRDFNISQYANLTSESYNNLTPTQWPVTEDTPKGTSRMFTDGRYFTDSGKAQFITVQARHPVNSVSGNFPLILNTGRVRDQWHTMTRTGKSPRLAEHSPEPYAEMHPKDVRTFNLTEGALAQVSSELGSMVVRVCVSEAQQVGSIFIPIHWNKQFSMKGRVDVLVPSVTDPISGQPEFKYTPVAVEAYEPIWHGFLLSRREINFSDVSYWVKARGENFSRYELAGEQSAADWPAWARSFLCASENDVDWVEYLDESVGRYRGVRLVDGRLESCIFIAPTHDLPARNWLASLFAKDALSDEDRISLLTGKPPSTEKDQGKVVCACFGVGENTIVDSIQSHKLTTAAEIGKCLKAGTNCGSCVPELKALLEKNNR